MLDRPPKNSVLPRPCDAEGNSAAAKDDTHQPVPAARTTSPAQNLMPKRIAANRRNALRSTGPRTNSGKLAVSTNSIAHGVYALCPVIRPLESMREWNSYRAEMMTILGPLGMLETTLAERIISTAWRLRRVVSYEAGQIRLKQADALEVVSERFRGQAQRALEQRHAVAQQIEDELSYLGEKAGEVESPDDRVSDDLELTEEQASDLLCQAHAQLGLSGFDHYWQRLPKPEPWTAGLVRGFVWQLIAECDTKAAAAEAKRLKQEPKQQVAAYRHEHLLPDDLTLQKVARYEAHLSRQFHRDLHELQRIQATRSGQPVAMPVAIDLDITSGPGSEPNNGG